MRYHYEMSEHLQRARTAGALRLHRSFSVAALTGVVALVFAGAVPLPAFADGPGSGTSGAGTGTAAGGSTSAGGGAEGSTPLGGGFFEHRGANGETDVNVCSFAVS